MLVQLLVDNPNSWIIPYVIKLKEEIIKKFNFPVKLIYKHEDVIKGEVLCLLSCEKIFKNLNYNDYNLVIHESDLPLGKGWSPLTWQVLEGKNEIPMTLFEAAESVDAGEIYAKEYLKLNGSELLPEIKDKQGKITIKLILLFLENFPMKGKKQVGESTFYDRRKAEDSKLDINKSIADQFNLLRVCDNERYPAYFSYKGSEYKILIEKK
jgi:methionyl-tRNA formyltransferase